MYSNVEISRIENITGLSINLNILAQLNNTTNGKERVKIWWTALTSNFLRFRRSETLLFSSIAKIWRALAKISEFRIIYLAEIYMPRRVQMIVPFDL